MTKWFDTNYHYVVPEIAAPVEAFAPLPWREPLATPTSTWPILGPYSLVKLSKLADGLDPVDDRGPGGRRTVGLGREQQASIRTSACSSTSRASAWR